MRIVDSVVEATGEVGIALFGCSAEIERSIVRDNVPGALDGKRGRGINAQSQPPSLGRSQVTVRDSLVADNHDVGLLLFESDGLVERSTVRDTRPLADGSFGSFGDGLLASTGSTLTVAESTIVGSARAGVANFSANIVIAASRLECNQIQLDGEQISGPFSFDDQGGNSCSCGAESSTCKVQSASLAPPEPIVPQE
jgi:hypothetical protein